MVDEPEPWMKAAAELAHDELESGNAELANRIIRKAEERCDREAREGRSK